jgi:hypothetical protein
MLTALPVVDLIDLLGKLPPLEPVAIYLSPGAAILLVLLFWLAMRRRD